MRRVEIRGVHRGVDNNANQIGKLAKTIEDSARHDERIKGLERRVDALENGMSGSKR